MDTLFEKDAIHTVLAKYCLYGDLCRIPEWLELFTEDGILDAGPFGLQTGRSELERFMSGLETLLPALRHCTMNEIIEVEGQTASASSYVVVVISRANGILATGLAGRYEDELVKRDGAWLIKRRTFHLDLRGEMGPTDVGVTENGRGMSPSRGRGSHTPRRLSARGLEGF